MADARIPEFPDYSTYGDLAPSDYLLGYMGSVNHTVKIPLSAILALAADSATSQLSTPALSLVVAADDEIDASWSAITNATAYRLYRSETANFNDSVKVYDGAALLFNDTGLISGTQYYYWLQAIGSGYGDSGYSQGSATTTGAGADVTPPVLSSLEVSTTNPNQIILTYNETLQTVGSATTTQWTLTGKTCTFAAISGTTVTLTFNANFVPGEIPLLTYTGNQVKDIAGNLAPTFSNQAVTNDLTITSVRLSTPGNFKATPVSSSQINLSWDNVANESSFKVERSDDGATWSTLVTPSADVTSYNDTTPDAGTLYWYRLTAVGDGTSFTDSVATTTSATTPPSSGAEYDTILTFTTSTNDSDAGVNGAASGTSSNLQFQFNAITVRTGIGMRMTIKAKIGLLYVTQAIIDFPSDYLGKPFKFIDAFGNIYTSNFINNTIQFG
jgi:hypothetical protein